MPRSKWNYLFARAYSRFKKESNVKRLSRGSGRRQMATEINKPVDIALRDLHIADYMEVKEK